MLKENQKAIVKWNSANKSHYIEKGYKFTNWKDEFEVDVKDLTKGSHTKVSVICDYCGSEKQVVYKDYLKTHDEEFGDCCYNCAKKKREDVLMRDFGVKTYWKVDECKEKIRKICIEKYGVDSYMKTEEFRKKSIKTLESNGTQRTSKQQLALYELLLKEYSNCKLNHAVDYFCLDCFVEVEGVKIDIEYDGWYWHKDKESSDNKRDGYMFSKGIKVLRIKGRYEIPTIEDIKKCVKKLINGERYQEIILDWK